MGIEYIILGTRQLVVTLEEESLEIEGLEAFDIKILLEIAIEIIGKEMMTDINIAVKTLIMRLGFEVIQNSKNQEEMLLFFYKLMKCLNDILIRTSLTDRDLVFKEWLSKDMVVSYIK